MPRLYRHLSFALLIALLLMTLPAPRPAHAQNIEVTTTGDEDNGGANDCGAGGCTLREAIRLANSRTGPNTITFGVSGEITPLSPLPDLIDDGTTIDATGRSIVLNGSSAGEANGLTIRSSNNVIRGLVIFNFFSGDRNTAGSGIYINGAAFGGRPAGGDNNQIYGNRIGLNAAGNAAISNSGYGIFLTNGASNNIIGANNATDRNVIAGNVSGGIRLFNNNILNGLLSNNSIVGNFIGTDPTGEALPPGLNVSNVDSGIGVSRGSRNTIIRDNVIGGFNSGVTGSISAGINITGSGTGPGLDGQEPRGTVITGNYIGVSRGGTPMGNRIGISMGGGEFGPFDTVIGDASDTTSRNVIAGNVFRGIDLPTTGFFWGNVTIAGNYIGLNGSGTPRGNGLGSEGGSGAGIFIGRPTQSQPFTPGVVTIGPGNVISASGTYGVHITSGGHTLKGNLLGTNAQGSAATTSTANVIANILIENGNGITVGGPSPNDRNIMAFNGVVVNPRSNAIFSTGSHTIENNYIGVSVDGSTPLTTTRTQVLAKSGISLIKTSGNVIRGNVIGGLANGIVLGLSDADTDAGSNQILDNKIGAPASGELFFASYPPESEISARAPRNYADGIKIYRGTNNLIRGNLVSYNAADASNTDPYAGIRIGTTGSGTTANNNVVEDNRLVRNGFTDGFGISVDTADNVRLSRNTTAFNAGDGVFTFRGGINLSNGGNNNRAAPTGLAIVNGSPPSLTGTASGCAGCTVEVFGSSIATEDNEGPVYLASGTTTAGGTFSVPLPTCLRYLKATVTDTSGNTSRFSSQIDTGNPGPCQPVSFTLGDSVNPSRNVAPGETTTYTHTLSHNAPISLTYTVVFTSSQDWASAPPLVTVPPNGSKDIIVSVRVPPGTSTTAPVPVDTTNVQVFLGTLGSNVVTDITTPQAVTLNPAQPAVSGPLTQERTGATVTFNHVVTNTGDLAGTFLISTPTLTGAPADWSVVTPAPASLTLAGRATGNVSLVVNTPSLPLPTAPVTLTFQVSVQGANPPRTVTQNDYITIPTQRGFSFTPRSPETATTPAGGSVSFTYTLTNTGNVADSFTITPTQPAPLTAAVSSTPPLTNLAPGATAAVTVTYTVPSGTLQNSYPATITAAATSGTNPPASVVRDVTVNVTGGAALVLAAGQASPSTVSPGAGGALVTFSNTLTNTGNAAGVVTVGPVTGVPAGWTAGITSDTCTGVNLAPNSPCTFGVSVTVPEGAPGGAVPLGISATIANPDPTPDGAATGVNTVTVAIARGLLLAPDGLSATVAPGQVVTFTHTLTNTGNAADSFSLTVGQNPGGWTVAVSPTQITNLAPNTPRTVEVTAVAGAGVTGGSANTITLTATGQNGGPSASVNDTVTLASTVGGDLTGGGRLNVDPGGTATYTFTVRNTGNVPLAYTVRLSNSLGTWTAVADGVPTAEVAPGMTTTLRLNVTAPAGAAPGETVTTTVELVRADNSGDPFDSATATTAIGPRLGVLLSPKGVPYSGRPNSTIPLTYVLTNLGSEAGTFALTTTESLGWGTELTPVRVTLGPGDSVPVTLLLTVKPSATAGARNQTTVRVRLESDPTIADESINEITVPREANVILSSSQQRGVRPGTTTSLDSLMVFNSGTDFDFYRLRVQGESNDWDVILGQSIVGVNVGDPARVSVRIKVGAGVAPGTVRTITIQAGSSADTSKVASVQLTLTALGDTPAPPERYYAYLPRVVR